MAVAGQLLEGLGQEEQVVASRLHPLGRESESELLLVAVMLLVVPACAYIGAEVAKLSMVAGRWTGKLKVAPMVVYGEVVCELGVEWVLVLVLVCLGFARSSDARSR